MSDCTATDSLVDYLLVDETFPSGRKTFASINTLEAEFPGCYVSCVAGESGMRGKVMRLLMQRTILEIVSLSRHEVEIGRYWVRYYRLRFVPVEGHWKGVQVVV